MTKKKLPTIDDVDATRGEILEELVATTRRVQALEQGRDELSKKIEEKNQQLHELAGVVKMAETLAEQRASEVMEMLDVIDGLTPSHDVQSVKGDVIERVSQGRPELTPELIELAVWRRVVMECRAGAFGVGARLLEMVRDKGL